MNSDKSLKSKMYSHEIKPNLKKILEKTSKKDKNIYEQVLKKLVRLSNLRA